MAKMRSRPRIHPSRNVPIVSGSSRLFIEQARQHQLAEKKAHQEANGASVGWIKNGFKRHADFNRGLKLAAVEVARRDLRGHNPLLGEKETLLQKKEKRR